MLAGSGFIFFLHVIGNKREVGKAFLGNGSLLVIEYGLFRDGRLGGSGNSESGGHIGPWFPVGIGDRDRGQGPGRFPLRDNNRCLTRLVGCRHSLAVERCPAAVTVDRLAERVGSST